MNFHDVRLHNKTIGHVVDSDKVKFMMSDISLQCKVVLCAGVEIPPDSVGRIKLELVSTSLRDTLRKKEKDNAPL